MSAMSWKTRRARRTLLAAMMAAAGFSAIPRTVPAGLPTLPMTLMRVENERVVIDPRDAIAAALAYNAAICNAGIYYVKPSTGNDTTGDGSAGNPWATVAKAMRTATGSASRVRMLEDCVIPSFDLRSTDASQSSQQFKWLDGNGYNVIIRDTGPDLTAQTWTVDGTNTNCYKATLGVSGSAQITRVLRTDQLDGYGYTKQLAKYTSAAALNAGSGDGWYWDNSGKVLWIKIGAGTNVESQKSILKGLYLNSAGTSRIIVYGASLGLSGIRLEGVQIVHIDAGGRRPEIWLHNVTQLWANGKGADMTQSGWYIATDSTVYASQHDAVNAFAKSATGKGLVLTANCSFIRAGDQSVFPADATLQGTSAHGGSHHVGWGNRYLENNGQGVADTCAASEDDITWLVGCYASGYPAGTSIGNFLFGSAAASASRKVYLDACRSFNATSGTDLTVSTNATVYTHACAFRSVSGTVTDYSPASPP